MAHSSSRRRVADAHPDQEAVELRLGQRVGALVLDRVLGRQHQERALERARAVFGGDLALLHRLEQRRLGLRRGAVDLVRQQDVGEHRAGAELELGRALVEDRRAGDVGRHQVGGELHPREVHAGGGRERPRDQRLGQTRDSPRSARDRRRAGGERKLERGALPDHRALDLVDDARRTLRGRWQTEPFRGSGHEAPSNTRPSICPMRADPCVGLGPARFVPVGPRVLASGLLDLPGQHRQTGIGVSVSQLGRAALRDLERVPNAQAVAMVVAVAHWTEPERGGDQRKLGSFDAFSRVTGRTVIDRERARCEPGAGSSFAPRRARRAGRGWLVEAVEHPLGAARAVVARWRSGRRRGSRLVHDRDVVQMAGAQLAGVGLQRRVSLARPLARTSERTGDRPAPAPGRPDTTPTRVAGTAAPRSSRRP